MLKYSILHSDAFFNVKIALKLTCSHLYISGGDSPPRALTPVKKERRRKRGAKGPAICLA
jgi:hypothetical protein